MLINNNKQTMTENEILQALTDLKIQVSAYRAENTAQNTVTNAALQGINQRLDKINGSVASHENRIIPLENHLKNTEDLPTKIRQLEDSNLSNKAVKKFMAYMFASGMTLGAAIISLLKLILG